MSVNSCSRYVFVPEQALKKSQIHAILQEKGRAGMAQHVRRNPLFEPGRTSKTPQFSTDGLRRPIRGIGR
jgi:hypothetical protein